MHRSRHHHQAPLPIGLQDSCIHLAGDGTMRPHAKTAGRLRSASTSPHSTGGRTLALHRVNGPRDVHYPAWEMHPEGDELLVLTSGSVSVEFRERDGPRTARLPSQAALIVPAGVWHRLIVHEPSVLMAITPRHNTVHERGEAFLA